MFRTLSVLNHGSRLASPTTGILHVAVTAGWRRGITGHPTSRMHTAQEYTCNCPSISYTSKAQRSNHDGFCLARCSNWLLLLVFSRSHCELPSEHVALFDLFMGSCAVLFTKMSSAPLTSYPFACMNAPYLTPRASSRTLFQSFVTVRS
jgi:hypothetical protein